MLYGKLDPVMVSTYEPEGFSDVPGVILEITSGTTIVLAVKTGIIPLASIITGYHVPATATTVHVSEVVPCCYMFMQGMFEKERLTITLGRLVPVIVRVVPDRVKLIIYPEGWM